MKTNKISLNKCFSIFAILLAGLFAACSEDDNAPKTEEHMLDITKFTFDVNTEDPTIPRDADEQTRMTFNGSPYKYKFEVGDEVTISDDKGSQAYFKAVKSGDGVAFVYLEGDTHFQTTDLPYWGADKVNLRMTFPRYANNKPSESYVNYCDNIQQANDDYSHLLKHGKFSLYGDAVVNLGAQKVSTYMHRMGAILHLKIYVPAGVEMHQVKYVSLKCAGYFQYVVDYLGTPRPYTNEIRIILGNYDFVLPANRLLSVYLPVPALSMPNTSDVRIELIDNNSTTLAKASLGTQNIGWADNNYYSATISNMVAL